MSDFAQTALVFVTLSAMFPLVGFYLDWRSRKRKNTPSKGK